MNPSAPGFGSLAPPEAVEPCPHCHAHVGARPAERPVTRPRPFTFGGGWVLATVIVALASFLLLSWLVPVIFWIAKSGDHQQEVVGVDHRPRCIACDGPR